MMTTRVDFARWGPTVVKRWIREAQAGDKMVYHIGDLAADREFNEELDDAARRMLFEAKFGRVLLVQKRVKVGVSEYIAVRTGR